MQDIEGMLQSICESLKLSYTIYDPNYPQHKASLFQGQPVDAHSNLIKRLLDTCRDQKTSHIIIDLTRCGAGCVYDHQRDQLILMGLVYIGGKSQEAILTGLKKLKMSKEEMNRALESIALVPVLSLSEFQDILRIVHHYVNGKDVFLDEDAIVIYKENKVVKIDISDEIPSKIASVTSDIVYDNRQKHDAYTFELELMKCIREGNKNKLNEWHRYATIGYAGKLVYGEDTLRQTKNQFICACTLATRASIEGGLQPEIAYAVSDYYIQRAEQQLEQSAIEQLNQEMFLDFTQRVHTVTMIQAYSDITKRCIDYINAHIREPIQYQELADVIGMTKNYMLSKFKADTKFSMVDYIKMQKIEEAKHLLKYSEYSIVEISELLSFSSQSFFTSVFHALTNRTPKQYRDQHMIKQQEESQESKGL